MAANAIILTRIRFSEKRNFIILVAMQIIKTPYNPDTIKAHALKMALPNNDIPSQEDANVWILIKELAPNWLARKKEGISNPGYPIQHKDYWIGYSINCKQTTPFPQLDKFIDNTFGVGKTVIEIGPGTGQFTQKFLECGWNVIAVDPCFNALELIAHNNQTYADQLTLICKKITKFTPEYLVDLVICTDTFNYINPAKFQIVWEKIFQQFLKKDGMLFGSLFVNHPNPVKLKTINQYKELGAWFVPDSSHVRPLLEGTGYTIKETATINASLIHQFIAQKI